MCTTYSVLASRVSRSFAIGAFALDPTINRGIRDKLRRRRRNRSGGQQFHLDLPPSATLDGERCRLGPEAIAAHIQHVFARTNGDFISRGADADFPAIERDFGVRRTDLDRDCPVSQLQIEDPARVQRSCRGE